MVREGDVRVSRHCLWALLAVSEFASARPLNHAVATSTPRQTLSSTAVRIAAQYGMITSTFRTVEHNRAVGGVEDSYHLLGQAIDVVRRRGVSHAQIAAALSASGLHLIESLDEGNHSHFAFGPVARRQVPVFREAAEAPRRTPPTPKNLVAADEHGTLRLDLGVKHRGSQTKAEARGTGREAAH